MGFVKALVDADMLIDYDYGLYKLIETKYNNPKLIKTEMLNKSHEEILQLLKNRESENPLSILLNKDILSQADTIRDQLMEEEKELLYELVIPKDNIFKLLALSIKTGYYNVSVYCSDSRAKKLISDGFKNMTINFVNEREMELYNTYIFRHWEELKKYKSNELIEKNFYIDLTNFNITRDKIGNIRMKQPEYNVLMDLISIYFIDSYNYQSGGNK